MPIYLNFEGNKSDAPGDKASGFPFFWSVNCTHIM